MSFDSLKTGSIVDCVLRPFEFEKTYIKCPHCGEAAEVNTSIVLTSYPAQYGYHCKHCGKHGYIFCHELFERQIKKIPEKTITLEDLSTSCLVCGEPVPATKLTYEAAICEKCKKAILKVRKMLDE